MHFSAAVSASNQTPGSAVGTAGLSSTSTQTGSQGATLSIAGRVTVENPFVKMGAYHTLDLETNRDIRILKDEWDSVALNRVKEACEEGRGAEVGAIVCGEGITSVSSWFAHVHSYLRVSSIMLTLGTHDCSSSEG